MDTNIKGHKNKFPTIHPMSEESKHCIMENKLYIIWIAQPRSIESIFYTPWAQSSLRLASFDMATCDDMIGADKQKTKFAKSILLGNALHTLKLIHLVLASANKFGWFCELKTARPLSFCVEMTIHSARCVMISAPHKQQRWWAAVYSADQTEIATLLKLIIGRGDFCAGRSWARAAIN